MNDPKLRILLANTLDREGGAEQVAWSLLEGYRARGHEAWLAVGFKRTASPHVLLIDNRKGRNLWARLWWSLQTRAAHHQEAFGKWGSKITRALALMAEPRGIAETILGYENSHFPGTYSLLELPPKFPHIFHCHSLQRGYFELEALPFLSWKVPTVLTLHDAWLLSGHCTHPFACERWRTGCGNCPDLKIPPAILRDESAQNWRRKRALFQQSRLWVATGSQWMMQKVRASMLSYVEARVIYPGIDLDLFRPGDQQAARAELGLPQNAKILLFVAYKARVNPWKNFALLKEVMARVKQMVSDEVILFVVGDPAAALMTVEENVWLAPPMANSQQLASCYRAADIYVHATHVETFGLTLVEAMASAIPIVATDTGAIPEIVKEGESGFLTRLDDAEAMAASVVKLLKDEEGRRAMAMRAAQASKQFDVNLTVQNYLDWYDEILHLVVS